MAFSLLLPPMATKRYFFLQLKKGVTPDIVVKILFKCSKSIYVIKTRTAMIKKKLYKLRSGVPFLRPPNKFSQTEKSKNLLSKRHKKYELLAINKYQLKHIFMAQL